MSSPLPVPALVPVAVPAEGNAGFLCRAAEYGVRLRGPFTRAAAAGELRVDLRRYSVTVDGTHLNCTPRQVELLAIFLASPDRVWSREQLHWVCWGDASVSRRVDVQLCRIRGKLGVDLFRNIRDRGWALRAA
ncbi:MAG: winged helix-turn-helix domain-containing protein [Mycobacteriales bacterium]